MCNCVGLNTTERHDVPSERRVLLHVSNTGAGQVPSGLDKVPGGPEAQGGGSAGERKRSADNYVFNKSLHCIISILG